MDKPGNENSQSKLNLHVVLQPGGQLQNSQKPKLKCNLCGYEVYRNLDLISHMRKHTGERPFKCVVGGCGKEFKLDLTLKNHIKYKHSDARPLTCKFPGCLFTAKTDVNLIGHLKVHSDDRPFPCPNVGCNFRAKERHFLTRHVTSVHSEAKTFACSKCDYRAARADTLKYHMHRHTSSRDFKCGHPECTESFKTSFDLKCHFSNQHGKRNVACDQQGCGRKYATANALYKHKWEHHSKASRACPHPDCGFSTNKSQKSSVHMVVHAKRSKKIACPKTGCQYKGKHSRAVKLHVRKHEVLLPCPVSSCSGTKFTKDELKDHARFHNALGRPFQCPMCFKHYTTLAKLERHTAVHTKEKPYRCGHCEFGTFGRSGVKSHISAVHANFKFPSIVHPQDRHECLHCELTLPYSEFLVHSMSHAFPVVLIQRLETIWP